MIIIIFSIELFRNVKYKTRCVCFKFIVVCFFLVIVFRNT